MYQMLFLLHKKEWRIVGKPKSIPPFVPLTCLLVSKGFTIAPYIYKETPLSKFLMKFALFWKDLYLNVS